MNQAPTTFLPYLLNNGCCVAFAVLAEMLFKTFIYKVSMSSGSSRSGSHHGMTMAWVSREEILIEASRHLAIHLAPTNDSTMIG